MPLPKSAIPLIGVIIFVSLGGFAIHFLAARSVEAAPAAPADFAAYPPNAIPDRDETGAPTGQALLLQNVEISNGSSSNGDTSGQMSIPVTLGVWTHLLATWDGSNIRIYKNGALYETIAQTIDATPSGQTFNIGGAVSASAFITALSLPPK
jgi:hypothetical protein